MRYFHFLLFILLTAPLFGQTTCDIRVKLLGYNNDTLWFGTTFGRRAVPDFHAIKGPDDFFHLQSDKPLEEGMYAIIFKRGTNRQFLSCWLLDGQRSFTVETSLANTAKYAKVQGSPENALLFSYLDRQEELSTALNDLTNDWKVFRDETSYRAMTQKQDELWRFQSDLIRQNPGSRTAKLVEETAFIVPPTTDSEAHENWESEAAGRHHWFRQHYFDRMALASGNFLKYPLWVERTDYYFSKLPPPQPDSMVAMIEDIFQRMAPDKPAYEYYFGYILSSISRMSRYRTDEVFVHFVRAYVEQGRADFLDANRLRQYVEDANKMEPLFIGKKAPDVTFTNRAGNPVSVYGTEAPYTLLLFWLHDCGHCKKELPIVKQLYQEFLKEKGVKVISVCGKSGPDDTPKCWEFSDQLEMPTDWELVNDPQRRTRFSTLYNVSSYPRLFLLDAGKKILYRQSGSVPEEVLRKELQRAMQ